MAVGKIKEQIVKPKRWQRRIVCYGEQKRGDYWRRLGGGNSKGENVQTGQCVSSGGGEKKVGKEKKKVVRRAHGVETGGGRRHEGREERVERKRRGDSPRGGNRTDGKTPGKMTQAHAPKVG